MKFSLKFFLLFVAVVILVGAFGFHAYQRRVGIMRVGVSSWTANRFLPFDLTVPDKATDVAVYVDFGAAESEFAIPEDAFLDWCRSRGWSVEPILTPTQYSAFMGLPSNSRLVKSGYIFEPPDGQGVFDSDRSRACFWTSTFP